MKHLFQNWDGEIVAADTPDQAAECYNRPLGPSDEPTTVDEWHQIPDDKIVPIWSEETGERVTTTKPAREWAAEFAEPEQAATTYS